MTADSPGGPDWSDVDQLIDLDMEGSDDYPDRPDPEGEPATDASGAAEPPRLYYPTLDRWVAELLAPTYRRAIDDRNRFWCPSWWRHTEAIARLEALWRSWEHLRLDPATGVSVWFRDHADAQMAVLLSPEGPFKYCTTDKGHSDRLKPLPLDDPPPHLFEPPPR